MITIKVIYNDETDFIEKVAGEFSSVAYVELYNKDIRRYRKMCLKTLEDYGTKKLPLVVFEDENLEGIGALWSENTSDWKEGIEQFING